MSCCTCSAREQAAVIPLPVPVLRAVREAIEGRSGGPLLLNTRGERFRTASVAARLRRLAATAGITTTLTPHGLRRTFCTAGLVAGVPLRDMQYAMRHADSRTTMRYDMDRANLDRHAAHAVAPTSPGWPPGSATGSPSAGGYPMLLCQREVWRGSALKTSRAM
jgi:integrase